MLIESYARPHTPLWFREGLVLYLAGTNAAQASPRPSFEDVTALDKALRAPASEEQLRTAYAEAYARVAELARQHGKAALIGWVQNGLPSDVASGTTAHRTADNVSTPALPERKR